MPTLLVLTVSPRGAESITRELADHFVDAWQARHPSGEVVTRDLATTVVPPLDADWVKATFVAPNDRTPEMVAVLGQSDALTAELVDADEVVIASPVYNFTVPASLKAWIDVIVRFGVTFTPAGGLMRDKPVTAILGSREDFAAGSPMAHGDFATPYLRFILGYIGVSDFQAVNAGDYFSLRTGRLTRAEHVARSSEAVRAAATGAGRATMAS